MLQQQTDLLLMGTLHCQTGNCPSKHRILKRGFSKQGLGLSFGNYHYATTADRSSPYRTLRCQTGNCPSNGH